jgi:hypothetical protein
MKRLGRNQKVVLVLGPPDLTRPGKTFGPCRIVDIDRDL